MVNNAVQSVKSVDSGFPRIKRKASLKQVASWGLPVAAVLAVLAHFSMLAAGAIVGALFIIIALWQPRIALMITFALIPLQTDIPGMPVHLSISELCLALLFPICLLKAAQMGKPLRMGPLFWPIMAYLFFCFISSLSHFHPHSPAITAYAQMVVYLVFGVMLCASFPGDTDDLRFALEGAVAMSAVFALMVLLTHFHYPREDKNAWGAVFGSTFVMALEFWLAAKSAGDRKKGRLLFWALIVIGAALFLCLSRGGWLEAMAGSFVLLLLRKRFGLMLRVGLIVVPLAGLLYLTLPKEKQHYAFDFKSNARNIDARYKSIDYAWAQFNSNPVFGVGVQLRKEMDATDLFMVTLAESGVQGVLAFLLIHAVAAGMAWKIHKRLDPRDPRFSLVAIGAALVFQRFAHGMVDQYWCRGPLIWAWCAAGMMTAVWFEVRRRPQRAHEVNRKDA
ncbi:MAG: O-antigen ligase family protein [Planctomycetes bacterium]|nr:O-antigen ligase family protein [Planctomycetota bacterium]